MSILLAATMRPRSYFLEGLLDLPQHEDPSVRRALFRQSIASLGLAGPEEGPGPLDGLSAEAIAQSIRVARQDGLLDDLTWLAPGAAAVALYEIAGALPLGAERRDLGRRVLAHLYDGNAATFVAVATRMASGSARALSGAGVRARVALSLWLPSNSGVAVDPLALALASRRELSRVWIGEASTGSLPERLLAARLLERAAREAARRASQGDTHALHIFGGLVAKPAVDTISAAWNILLADRETLVWRHVAAARGLLSAAIPALRDETEAMLTTSLSPTEWRRGATSLVASLAVDPERALSRSLDLLMSPLVRRDPGIATAMTWGLARAADVEPEATEELLDAIVALAPIAVADSLVELRVEIGPFGEAARNECIRELSASLEETGDDDGLEGLARSILRDLTHEAGTGGELFAAVREAIDAFVETGPRAAHTLALAALSVANETVTALEALDVDENDSRWGSMSRRTSVGLLRDLEMGLLDSGVLKSLLLLDRRASDEAAGASPIDDLEGRLAGWLIEKEARPLAEPYERAQVTFHQRQLRALLHLLDGDTSDLGDDQERRAKARARWSSACSALTSRLTRERGSPLQRTIAAALARGFDAMVREGATDAIDVLLHAAMRIGAPSDLDVLAEASMHPDLTRLLKSYARFARVIERATPPVRGAAEANPLAAPLLPNIDRAAGAPRTSVSPSSSRATEDRIEALSTLMAEIPAEASQRAEALRGALSRLIRGLEVTAAAPSLQSLVSGVPAESAPLELVEDGVTRLAQLTAGASQRCGETAAARDSGAPRPAAHPLLLAVARVVQDLPDGHEELVWSIGAVARSARETIPLAMAQVVVGIISRLAALQVERPSQPESAEPVLSEATLPAWLPSRRTLGGFYVHKPIGSGGASSVFMVTRVEERHDPGAERFALKVPDYDATAARSLSEAEFLKLFREEAGALLSLPEHPNLARFVTFDAGAKPKPILVMELIEGLRCDLALDTRKVTTAGAFALLDGVLAGLEAMHAVGIGHLDVKPSNVVLRGGTAPVLVDFGLAGRQMRPGCATGCYGAPEVWGIVPEGVTATPLTADVYSFGCLAFEVLTGRTLFDATSEVALVSAHLIHDGLPQLVQQMREDPRLEPLVRVLYQCLRQNPRDRASVRSIRSQLAAVAPTLAAMPWPLAKPQGAEHARDRPA